MCSDGLSGIKQAIESAFPNAVQQRCIVHLIRNSCKCLSYKDRKEFCGDLKKVYSATNKQSALDSLAVCKKKWGEKYPYAFKPWEDNWNEFLKDPEVVRRGLRPIVSYEVDKMMKCGTLDSGFEIYECPNCHKSHIICYTCKSRFCNSCGTKYAKQRAESISANTLNVAHRHIVFTLDERLRDFFKRDRDLLNILFFAAKDTLTYVFDNMNGKERAFKPGFILTLHTFGRSLNWNPHIHCLVTEGGMDEKDNYKHIKYISFESLRRSFMKQVLDYLKDHYEVNHPQWHCIKCHKDTLIRKSLFNSFNRLKSFFHNALSVF